MKSKKKTIIIISAVVAVVILIAGIAIYSSWYNSRMEGWTGYGETSTIDEITSGVKGIILVIVILLVYFIPTTFAVIRNHHQVAPILIINLFLGWTFIRWVICFAWSLSSVKK